MRRDLCMQWYRQYHLCERFDQVEWWLYGKVCSQHIKRPAWYLGRYLTGQHAAGAIIDYRIPALIQLG
jgi:hypothetical protein